MKRNTITGTLSHKKLMGHKQRIAFHEAGHAAGIHLNNKARQLPSVFFNIILKDMSLLTEEDILIFQASHDDCIARVEGGRLIELLPDSFDRLMHKLTDHNEAMQHLARDYNKAFEADIINLLIGPLSEAKHITDIDGEPFNHKLITLNALKNYGGSSDLALAYDYLNCFFAEQNQRDEKLAELFSIAFDFINNGANWAAITKLADYILAGNKKIICCEEIVSILDQAVVNFQNRKYGIWKQWPFEIEPTFSLVVLGS
jgi:hypothetical protein